jgi:transposase-like protein
MSVLSQPQFHNEEAAFAYVEAELWPNGPVCPHCGGFERISAIKANPEKRIRAGLKFCGQCRKQFTVRVGTIFEESKLPMTKWLQAIFLMVSSKKGVSAHQLHRTLETTYKTAWFLAHRIREAMRDGTLAPFGAGGGMVEADETFIGHVKGAKVKQGIGHKMKVLSLVDRATGAKRSMVLPDYKPQTIADMVSANLHREAVLMTDEAGHYKRVGQTVGERRLHLYEHHRRQLRHLQARDARRIPALRGATSPPLSGRVRLPIYQPDRTGRGRSRAGVAGAGWCHRQETHVSSAERGLSNSS